METINEMNNLIYNSDKILEKEKRIIIKKFEKIKNNTLKIYNKLAPKCKKLLKETNVAYIHLHRCLPELNAYCKKDRSLNEVVLLSIYWYDDYEGFWLTPEKKNIFTINKDKFSIKWRIRITYKKNISLTICQTYSYYGNLIFGIYYANKKYNLRFYSTNKIVHANIIQTINKLKILDKIEKITKNLNVYTGKYKKIVKKYFK
jgi:hypothetical protein